MDVLESSIGMAVRKSGKRPKARQDHPTGPLDTVDDVWKNEVRAAMKLLGMDQADLAAKTDRSEGSISNMFKPGPRQIRFKRQVEEAVGMLSSAKLEEIHRRVSTKWHHLSSEDAEIVANLVDSLAAKRQSGS